MTSSAAARDAVIERIPTDIRAAEALAAAVPDAWYRAQALAWVARHAPEAELGRLSQLAFAAAADNADAFRQTASAAWVLRALMERDRPAEALQALEVVLAAVPRITPAPSRSEALFLLFQAMFEADAGVRRSLLFALAELHDADPHWRIERNFRDALVQMKGVDVDFARTLARGRDAAAQRRIDRAMAEESGTPRAFFW